jgi:hypothetical protein
LGEATRGTYRHPYSSKTFDADASPGLRLYHSHRHGYFSPRQCVPQSFINPYLPVVSFHFEIKDSGSVEHADFETDATSSSTIVEDDNES